MPLRPGGTAMGTDVVARPVKRSGWKLWMACAVGGAAEPADAVDEPGAACARAGNAHWLTVKAIAVSPAVSCFMS